MTQTDLGDVGWGWSIRKRAHERESGQHTALQQRRNLVVAAPSEPAAPGIWANTDIHAGPALVPARRHARLWLGGVTLWAVFGLLPFGVQAESNASRLYAATASRISDGDTLWVKPLSGGRYRKLRLEGMDAPEICQAGGVASRDALAAMVRNEVVTVAVRRYDDYGRAVVRLQVRGEDVGAQMVRAGHAWSYRWRRSNGPYAKEEDEARRLGKGLFAQPNPEQPQAFRRRHGPCPQP